MSISCIGCGEQNDHKSVVNTYCISCGEELPDIPQPVPTPLEPPVQSPPLSTRVSYVFPSIPRRNPLAWVLASILIPFFIYFYAYRNFQDMQDLNRKYHKFKQDMQDPVLMLILFIVFPPLTIYYKFEQFHHHLSHIHNEDTHFPDGTGIILHTLGGILVIFLIFLTVVYLDLLHIILASALVTVAFGIHLSYYHYHWQKDFNTHLLNHQKILQG